MEEIIHAIIQYLKQRTQRMDQYTMRTDLRPKTYAQQEKVPSIEYMYRQFLQEQEQTQ